MDGACNCGRIKLHVNDPDLFSGQRRGHICHCKNCQKTAGSVYGANLLIETDRVTITGADNLTLYEDPDSLSGNVVRRFFCKTCGNPIKSETKPASDAGKVVLKLGIMDRLPEPEHEAFCMTKQPWLETHEGTKRWETKVGGEPAKGV